MNRNRQKYFVFTEIMQNQWDNTTLDEFVKIREVLSDTGRTKEDKMIGLAAIVQGVSEDTILTMPLAEVEPIFARVQGLDNPPQRGKIRRQYQVGKWALKTADAKTMSVAQWIDFQNYYRADFDKHLKDILSVALVPIGKTYNEGYDIEELKVALGGMYVKDALAVCFFFQRRWLRSMRHTLSYWVGWTTLKGNRELRNKALRLRKEVSDLLRSL